MQSVRRVTGTARAASRGKSRTPTTCHLCHVSAPSALDSALDDLCTCPGHFCGLPFHRRLCMAFYEANQSVVYDRQIPLSPMPGFFCSPVYQPEGHSRCPPPCHMGGPQGRQGPCRSGAWYKLLVYVSTWRNCGTSIIVT